MGSDFNFRGRIYPKSCISPTGTKIIKYLYYYEYYNNEKLKNIEIRNINEEHAQILKNCVLFKIFNKINLENKLNIYYCYLCLFGIGKIFKNKLGSKKRGFLMTLVYCILGVK